MKKNNSSPSEFDAYKEDYSSEISKAISFAGQSHDFFTKVKSRYLSYLLDKETKTGETLKVLDVGCGHGLIHPHLLNMTKSSLKLTGIDVASSVIEMARQSHPSVTYSDFDGKNIPYGNNTFSVVFTICVMHHVPAQEWSHFLLEMKRVLKPGGMLVVIEHNPLNPLTLWTVKNCPIDKDAVLLTNKKLKKMFRSVSLHIEESRFILFTPIDSIFFRNMDEKLGWLPLGAQYYLKARK